MSIKFDKNFKQQVLAIEKEMIEDAKELTAFVLVTFHSFAVAGSPVDTGRYKASHVFEVGSRGNSTDGKDTAKELKQFRFDFITKTYYIANNLEYASILEAGRSKQALDGVYSPAQIKMEVAMQKKFPDKRYK